MARGRKRKIKRFDGWPRDKKTRYWGKKWHEIAKRIPVPGRPAAHCLTRYQTALNAGNTRSTFAPEIDAILREAVLVFGEKSHVVAELPDGRVSEQIRHRWQLSLALGLG